MHTKFLSSRFHDLRDIGSRITTLIILNDKMEDIIKIVKSVEDSNLLLKQVGETIQYEAK